MEPRVKSRTIFGEDVSKMWSKASKRLSKRDYSLWSQAREAHQWGAISPWVIRPNPADARIRCYATGETPFHSWGESGPPAAPARWVLLEVSWFLRRPQKLAHFLFYEQRNCSPGVSILESEVRTLRVRTR